MNDQDLERRLREMATGAPRVPGSLYGFLRRLPVESPVTSTSGGFPRATRSGLRAALAVGGVAAALAVAVIGGLLLEGLHGSGSPPSGGAPGTSASSRPTRTAASTPTPPVTPSGSLSDDPAAVWTGLAWSDVSSTAPTGDISSVTAWRGGYLAAASDGSASRLWTSTDGLRWTELPVGTLGANATVSFMASTTEGLVAIGTVTSDGQPCASGGACPALVGAAWASSDGRAWRRTADLFATAFASGPQGVVVATPRAGGGTGLWETADGTTWRPVTLPAAMAQATISDLVSFGGGFLAAGYVGSGTTSAAAWWSADGRAWSRATVTLPAGGGNGFDHLYPGRLGVEATTFTPHAQPSHIAWWRSPDGRRWALDAAGSPLGMLTIPGPLAGRPIGQLAADGDRIVVLGDPDGMLAGAVSFGDGRWTPLAMTGSGAALRASGPMRIFVLPTGILMATPQGVYLATAR